MTFESYFRPLFGLLLFIFFLMLARALWNGRTKFSGVTYMRAVQPVDYWREIGLQLSVLALLTLAIIFASLPGEPGPHRHLFNGAMLTAVSAPPFVRAVWTRNVSLGHTQLGRTERPRPYWFCTLGLGALTFVSIALILFDLRR